MQTYISKLSNVKAVVIDSMKKEKVKLFDYVSDGDIVLNFGKPSIRELLE